MNSIRNFFFKILQTSYFEYFENPRSRPSTIIYPLVEHFDAKSIEINLQETLMFIWMQKIKFISNFFFDILLRHCKLAILGTLGILDHPHQKSWYQFVGNFYAYLHAKKVDFFTHVSLVIVKK